MLVELIVHLIEGNDFSRAHKGEIERIKEEDHIFSGVVILSDSFERVDMPRDSVKVWGLLSYEGFAKVCELHVHKRLLESGGSLSKERPGGESS